MEKPVVYLCGPIAFCTDGECVAWREKVKADKSEVFTFLDPLRRDYRGAEIQNVEKLVHDDLEDIENSHALLVGHTRPSTGTAMEIVYAFTSGKPVVVVAQDLATVSPWIIYHATKVTDSWEEGYTYLEELATGFMEQCQEPVLVNLSPVG